MYYYPLEELKERFPECPVLTSRERVPEGFTLNRNASAIPIMGVLAFIPNIRGAVAFTKENRGMLGQVWNLPGGSPEEGETFQQAIQREVFEELGLDIEDFTPVLIYDKTYFNDQIEGQIIFLVFRSPVQPYQKLAPRDSDVLQAEWFFQIPYGCLDQELVGHLWAL